MVSPAYIRAFLAETPDVKNIIKTIDAALLKTENMEKVVVEKVDIAIYDFVPTYIKCIVVELYTELGWKKVIATDSLYSERLEPSTIFTFYY